MAYIQMANRNIERSPIVAAIHAFFFLRIQASTILVSVECDGCMITSIYIIHIERTCHSLHLKCSFH